MEHADQSALSPNASTFAGLLAALTAPEPGPETNSAWPSDGLEDDVATLSYERALRAHARYRRAEADDRSLTQAPEPATFPAVPPLAAAQDLPRPAPSLFERNLKSASVTIRMSQAECDQLHQRAAAAGLTVSAYLRSCTFEAESLRAMVRDTMAQLKQVAAAGKQAVRPRRSFLGWLKRIFAPWQPSRRAARA